MIMECCMRHVKDTCNDPDLSNNLLAWPSRIDRAG